MIFGASGIHIPRPTYTHIILFRVQFAGCGCLSRSLLTVVNYFVKKLFNTYTPHILQQLLLRNFVLPKTNAEATENLFITSTVHTLGMIMINFKVASQWKIQQVLRHEI